METRICAYCKSNRLELLNNDSYICKSCKSINYAIDREINIKFVNAQTALSTYDFTTADNIYKRIIKDNELKPLNNPQVEAMALSGRIHAHFGIIYVQGSSEKEAIATFANYNKNIDSITQDQSYQDLLKCNIQEKDKDKYISKFDILDKEYKQIKFELSKIPEYDVFICTKISPLSIEKDEYKSYTIDYHRAEKIYDKLTKKGLNVFLSEVSLSGVEYDSQIFSALMRSKVMLVISSTEKYLESCWVESEWQRWLNFIEVGEKFKNTLFLYLLKNEFTIPNALKHRRVQKYEAYEQDELLSNIYKVCKSKELEHMRLEKEKMVQKEEIQRLVDEEVERRVAEMRSTIDSEKEELAKQEVIQRLVEKELERRVSKMQSTINSKKVENAKSVTVKRTKANQFEKADNEESSITKRIDTGKALPKKTKIEVVDINSISFSKGLILTLNKDNKSYRLDKAGTCKDKTVIIPNIYKGLPVTIISSYAFSGCNNLERVIIPDSVTSIGEGAFYGCNSLESITLPFIGNTLDGTRNVHFGYIFGARSHFDNSIYVPTSLKEVVITGGKSIGEKAFYGCSSLESIEIPDGVTSIGESAFFFCYGLTSTVIPNSVTRISNGAFRACRSLESIVIPSSVTSIGKDAFNYCSSLKSIVIPNSVISIGEDAFYWCSSLESIVIPSSVTSIGEGAFSKCSRLESITIPNSVTSIARAAFSKCSRLESITIPSSVTSIGKDAFSFCSRLESITIPSSVTSIGDAAFAYCSSLAIYCEVVSQPSGWSSNWNSVDARGDNIINVIWGYKKKVK